MNYRHKLTNYEWNTLLLTPLWIFPTVVLADGKFDDREKNALFLISNNAFRFTNPLLQEIFEYYNVNFDNIVNNFFEDSRKIKKGLSEVAEILQKNVDTETAIDFKKTMIAIGYFIAKASGDEFTSKISPREKKTLNELAKSLKLNMTEFDNPPTMNDIFNILERA